MIKGLIAAIIISLTIVSCVTSGAGHMIGYLNYDFHHSFRKYMIKDGYVKYFAVDTSMAKDTTWIDVYFDDFGSREYIHLKSKTENREWFKGDSIQYEKSQSGYFDSSISRKEDVPTEKVVVNSTSRFYNGAYTHKPSSKKFKQNKKYKKLVGGFCWTYLNSDSAKVDCDVLYYFGVPIDIYICGREPYQYNVVRAETIDTAAAFPLILKVK